MDASRVNAPGSPVGRMSSVLVVDAEPQMRTFLERSLRAYFSVVEVVEDLASAIELQQRCHYDLVIAELDLPAQSALEWIASVRARGEQIEIIFMTETTDVDMLISALRADVQDIILKPFNIEQIKASVERFVDKQQCKRENRILRRQVENIYNPSSIVGNSDSVKNLQEVIRRVAPMPSTVLIEGESGTGKELVARALHDLSGRKGSFVPVNCGGMTAELMESELFGHAKGAFTGAHQSRDGLFNYASKGTLFLDEIGEMPMPMQAHLLRVLEERTVRPVGANQETSVDVRIVAATNRNLKQMVDAGRFRRDLYYRLNVLTIGMPALRDRMDDIPVLTRYFCKVLSTDLGVSPPAIEDSEMSCLSEYDWPGNVRELKNVIERCLLLNYTPSYCLSLPEKKTQMAGSEDEPQDLLLESVEKKHILKVLKMQGGNKSAASRELGISRKTLERKCKDWGIS